MRVAVSVKIVADFLSHTNGNSLVLPAVAKGRLSVQQLAFLLQAYAVFECYGRIIVDRVHAIAFSALHEPSKQSSKLELDMHLGLCTMRLCNLALHQIKLRFRGILILLFQLPPTRTKEASFNLPYSNPSK